MSKKKNINVKGWNGRHKRVWFLINALSTQSSDQKGNKTSNVGKKSKYFDE